MIYCDNAATTFPKPLAVYDAVLHYMKDVGANPGRSSHALTHHADTVVFDTREQCAALFNGADSSRIVFTFNATEALNTAMFGLLNPGDSVAVSPMEHNAVMRPLRFLQRERHITIKQMPSTTNGVIDLDALDTVLKSGIRLVIINHASNICGTIQPLEAIGALVHRHNSLLLVDAAQSAGSLPIDVQNMHIDLLAFSGHKGLYGPQGTGALYIGSAITLRPLKFGGTGSKSESEEQPDFLPDAFESGTLNAPGIAGLGAGIDFINRQTVPVIRQHGIELTRHFLDALCSIPSIATHGVSTPETMLPTISLTINNKDPGEIARRLSDEFGICCRMGLHCAPAAHRTLGTFPNGTLRFSFGYFNTHDDIDTLISALRCCA
jgi:cysteine desulfurase / selenocysteine lyase